MLHEELRIFLCKGDLGRPGEAAAAVGNFADAGRTYSGGRR